MNNTTVLGCPTGDMIRFLIGERRRQKLRAGTEHSGDLYGALPDAEQTPGICILVDAQSEVFLLLSEYDQSPITDTLVSEGWKRPDSEVFLVVAALHCTARDMFLADSSMEVVDLPLLQLDLMAGRSEWERRNQPSNRPPRRLTFGTYRKR